MMAKTGVRECASHELVTPYSVAWEDNREAQLAHVKFTVLLTPGGNVKVTGLAPPTNVVSDKKLPADLQELVDSVSVEKKKKNRGNKKGKK